ncbi:MAG: DUF2726 domain-containing protein [Rhodocyclaceae bacterium]|jgi:hypothetical protein|nr:DUF2726 domain-containing protein [Rhodocyclaceae bacterium]
MAAFLVLVAVAVGLGWLVWRTVRRAREARRAAEEREAVFLASLATPRPVPREDKTVPTLLAPRIDVLPPAADAGLARAGRPYLSRAEGLIFRALKEAFPVLNVFPRASLRRVLGGEALAKDLRVDFVVCGADLTTRAVVDLARAEEARAVADFKAERLTRAGVGYLRVDGQQPPSADELRLALQAWCGEGSEGRS